MDHYNYICIGFSLDDMSGFIEMTKVGMTIDIFEGDYEGLVEVYTCNQTIYTAWYVVCIGYTIFKRGYATI